MKRLQNPFSEGCRKAAASDVAEDGAAVFIGDCSRRTVAKGTETARIENNLTPSLLPSATSAELSMMSRFWDQ
jgi:hypothetical protein